MSVTFLDLESGQVETRPYTEEEIDAISASQPEMILPRSITAAQFHQQLIIDGKDEAVQPAIENIPDETKRKLVMARYQFETVFNIDDPDLLMLAGAIGYNTQKKIQDFFNSASQIGA